MSAPSGTGFRFATLLLVLAGLLAAPAALPAAVRYQFIPLSSIPGGFIAQNRAYALNNQGVVVGDYQYPPGFSSWWGFRWDSATGDFTYIPHRPDSSGCAGYAINDAGVIAGGLSGVAGGAFLWDGVGDAVSLGALHDASASSARGVTAGGTVVGTSGYSTPVSGGITAYVWDAAGGMRPIGFLPGDDHSSGSAINERGQVAGCSWIPQSYSKAFLWDPAAGFTALAPDALWSAANDIAPNGDVAGWLNRDTDGDGWPNGCRAVLWPPSTGTAVELKAGVAGASYVYTSAEAVNGRGVVVGQYQQEGAGVMESFVWRAATGMLPLRSLLGPAAKGWHQLIATDINDAGTIAGYGYNPDGFLESFVLVDALEPPPGNLLGNGSFEEGGALPDNWSAVRLAARDQRVCGAGYDGGCLFTLRGGTRSKALVQELAFPDGAGTKFVLASWAQAAGLSPGGGFSGLRATATYADGTTRSFRLAFPRRAHGWLYRSAVLDLGRPAASIAVSVALERQTGRATFDRVTLAPAP